MRTLAIVPSARLVVRGWRRHLGLGLVVCVGSLKTAWTRLSRIGTAGAVDAEHLKVLEDLTSRLERMLEDLVYLRRLRERGTTTPRTIP